MTSVFDNVPETLNGWPVIAARRIDSAMSVPVYRVVVFRRDHAPSYVVATWNETLRAEWHAGTYVSTLQEAADAFKP